MQILREKVSQALRSSERLLKLDVAYLIKGGWWTSLSFGISALASLVTMVAFGNWLPREAFGTYNYLLSLGASLSFLTLSGIGPAVMRAVARGYENVVPYALRLQLKYNLAASFLVFAIALYYGLKGNALFASSLLLLILAYPVAEAFHLYKNVLTARARFDLLTQITALVSVIGAFATVGILFLTDNIFLLILLYAFMSLVPNVFVYHLTKGKNMTKPDDEQISELRRSSFHFTGAGLIGVIASYIDKILLFQVVGPAALAVYGFALAGPDRLKSLMKNWGSIALPRLAQKSLSQIRQIFYQRLALSLGVGTILALGYWAVAPILFKIFLPYYLDAIPYSQVLSLALITAPVSIYIGSIFSSQNMLKATYALNFGNHLARVILFVVLVYFWQTWGLVAATVASSFINAFYSLFVWEVEARRLILKNE